MKPIVLITGEEGFDPLSGTANFLLNRKYSNYVSKAGGLPFMPEDVRMAKEYVGLADGLLLTHGPDVHRGRYGEYYTGFKEIQQVCAARDDFEFTLFSLFFEAKKPVLGIGRGMQIINTALGGTLHLKGEHNETLQDSILEPPKDIYVDHQTKLYATLGSKLPLYLLDFQRINKLGINVKPVAFFENESVEALEHEFLPIFGIGWNPLNEKSLPLNHLLFHYFIQLCKGDEKI